MNNYKLVNRPASILITEHIINDMIPAPIFLLPTRPRGEPGNGRSIQGGDDVGSNRQGWHSIASCVVGWLEVGN